MASSLSLLTSPSRPLCLPKPATCTKWNDALIEAVCFRLNRIRLKPGACATGAGPVGCEDRPWWWGQLKEEPVA